MKSKNKFQPLAVKKKQTKMVMRRTALICATALSFSATANDTAVKSFNIPAQSLQTALNQFSETTDMQMSYPAALADGVTAPEVSGNFTTEQALDKLLEGSGLEPKVINNTITIKHPDNSALTVENLLAAADDDVNYPVANEESSDYSGPVEQEDLTVSGREMNGYNVISASTATKTDTPILETPVSIQVIPRGLMDDQQVVRLQDVTKNVSGVQRDFTFGNGYESFTIRGFSSRSKFYRNGNRIFSEATETAHIQQVEVLKGPAAMLFGRIEPGGLVNIVTKKPQEEAHYALQQQFGSYDFYRTTFDATGSITDDKSLLYRLNVAYLDSNSFRDVVYDERIFVAPSITWRPNDSTEINLNYEYKNEDTVDDSGIPAVGNRPADIPSNRFLGEPWEDYNAETHLVDLNWSHKFNEDWKIANGFVWNSQLYKWRETYHASLDADNQTLNRAPWFIDADRWSYTVFGNVNGEFDTFGLHHNVLMGGDFYSARTGASTGIDYEPMSSININNPVYGSANSNRGELDALRRNAPNAFANGKEHWYGVYFQDQIKFWDDKIHILGGGRYDWATTGSSWSTAGGRDPLKITKNEHFSPRVGLLIQPWEWLSVYGNFVESIGSNNSGRSQSGKPFDPELATQFEVGLKTELFDGLLSSTLAFYHLTKENVLTPDLSNTKFKQAIGEARSQGIEVDIKGQLTDAFSLIATYAYTDARITKSNNTTQGNRLFNVPEHSGSLWAKYAFVDTSLKGLSFGAGVYLSSEREGDNENTFQLPGYARVDAMTAYSVNVMGKKLTTQLNVNNLFDKEYFASSAFGRSNILPAEPLTIVGSVKLEF